MTSPTNLVKEDDHVMLRKADNLRVAQVHRGRDVYIDKIKFRLDGIIGHPYGTLFEVKDGHMVKIPRHVEIEPAVEDKGIDTEKDNRHLLDQDSNQKLKQEEIEKMKQEGISGDNLVSQLIENSVTFKNKTGYAQEKWVKKKKKKHLMQFTVLRPSTRLMCEMLWSKGPSRICNLRIDSLSQMLTMGNVHANSTVMVVESCLGLVTGAVLERLGGHGKVISFYHGGCPMRCNLDNYDFSKQIMDTLYDFPLELVNSLKHETEICVKEDLVESNVTDSTNQSAGNDIKIIPENTTTTANNDNVNDGENKDTGASVQDTADVDKTVTESVTDINKKPDAEAMDVDNQAENRSNGVDTTDNNPKAKKWNKRGGKKKDKKDRDEARLRRAKEIVGARKIILEKNVDCLIVASKFHPTPIVLALMDFLAPSRQVVVFSQFNEALKDCYVYLREHKGLVNFRLTETWLREYQVLPNRSHPVIQMSGTGGYLLTGTTVVKDKDST